MYSLITMVHSQRASKCSPEIALLRLHDVAIELHTPVACLRQEHRELAHLLRREAVEPQAGHQRGQRRDLQRVEPRDLLAT